MWSFLENETDGRLISDRWLFWCGLVVFSVGQGMTSLSLEFVVNLRPIDYVHWMMLIGALMMVPFAITMPRTIINRVASPLLVLGIAGIVGMAVVDFVLWSFGTSPERFELVTHLMDEPAVWLPFLEIGPGWIFGFGVTLPGLYYLRRAPIGAVLVVIGGLMLPFGLRYYVLLGYPVIIIGYAICFLMTKPGATSAD